MPDLHRLPDVPKVLALGSCRVFRPLQRLHAAGHIDLLYYGTSPHWWFTHSAGEARQYLQAIRGQLTIPEPMRPLICETTADLPEDLTEPGRLPTIDLAVLEISTLKAFTAAHLRLNIQRVWGYAHAAGVDTGAVLAGRPVEWPADHPLLADLSVERETPESVAAQVLGIREAVGVPLLTVDHLFATTADGTPVPGREEITTLLARLEREDGIAFHSTRPLIERHGEGVALKDSTHYAADFEPVVGEDLWASIQRTTSTVAA
jgi:hypothetical protein